MKAVSWRLDRRLADYGEIFNNLAYVLRMKITSYEIESRL